MSNVRQYKRWLVGLLLIATLTALAWILRPPERLLLERATKVADIKGWNTDAQPFYAWLSNQEVIFWRYHGTKFPFAEPLYKRDLGTGREVQIGDAPARASIGPRTPDYSPDGTLYLWFEETDVEVREVGSTRRAALPQAAHSHIRGRDEMLWTQDSRRWLLVDWGEPSDRFHARGPLYIWIGAPDAPSRAVRIPIVPNSPLREQTADAYGAAMTSQNRMLATGQLDRDTLIPNLDIFELDPWANGRLCRKFTVRFPFAVRVQDAIFSPEADRIAWRFTYTSGPTAPPVIQRWLPFLRSPARDVVGLWISHTDGSDMLELGHILLAPHDDTSTDDERPTIHDLCWLPDGKRLSFIHKGALYLVPTQ